MTSIYTDGSCIGNPGPGGWAFYVIDEKDGDYCMSGKENHSTNNRMELKAVIEALETLSSGSYTIYSDSQLVINCAQGKWKRKKNLDLWSEYEKVKNGKHLNWIWVKGHNGDKYNEIVDSMAQYEARSLKLE